MKEFIEKLICTLEEQKTEYRNIRKNTYCRRTEMDDCDSCRADHYLDARLEGINKAIKIVNELAEEYKGGWIPCSREFPEDDTKQYIVQKTNGLIDILGFTKDAYKLDKYDFVEYKGKEKQLFYDYDVEYGYIEWECEAWMPLPEKYKGE